MRIEGVAENEVPPKGLNEITLVATIARSTHSNNLIATAGDTAGLLLLAVLGAYENIY